MKDSYLLSLFTQNPIWSWVVLGLVLLAIEIAAPGQVVLWFGIAALLTGMLTFVFDFAWQTQLLAFILMSIISLVIWFRFFRIASQVSEDEMLNKRGERLIGNAYEVIEPIRNGRGKVKVDDSLWIVEGSDTKKGETVTITGVKGSILITK